MAHDTFEQALNRRGFLRLAGGGAITAAALSMLNACAPAAPATPSKPAAAPTTPAGGPAPTAAAGTASSVLPTYVPFGGGPKPDYPAQGPLYQDAFLNYPANPFKAQPTEPPASGGAIEVFIAAYYPPPTPYEQNRAWQEINRLLGANVQMNIIPRNDVFTKLSTLMAGGALPDIIHLTQGANAQVANLPQFLQAQCADLTPFLAGDAIKEYPNLAAQPTPAWRNTAVFNNKILAVPVSRSSLGQALFKVNEIYDKEIGKDYEPKNADDYKRILQQLNRPQESRWATGSYADAAFDMQGYSMIFGAPHNWKFEGGKLTKDYETEEYKAAVGFVRDLNAAGLFHPDSLTHNITTARQDFAAGRFAVHVEGYAPWNDFWRQGRQQNPPNNFGMIYPFAAFDGGKPQYNLYQGYIAANALKKASPERIKELLRVMNWLAAPFGSQEDMLLSYGIKDIHYTLDDKGNPKPTQVGNQEAGFVPWRYIAQRPQVIYMADIPGYVEAAVEAEKRLIPIGVSDPTLGHYSVTQTTRGSQVQLAMLDGVRDIVAARRPLSDYDQIVKDWASAGGEQIRQEYLRAISGAA